MGSLNRRALFGAAPALAVIGLPVAAVAFNADQQLVDLGMRWDRATLDADRLGVELDEALDRFKAAKPSPPRVRVTKADERRSRHVAGETWGWPDVEKVAKDAIEWRREPQRHPSRIAWAGRFEKAVANHKASVANAEIITGYAAAHEAYERAYQMVWSIERSIMALPCRTLPGAQIKARVAAKNDDNDVGSALSSQVCAFILKMGAH